MTKSKPEAWLAFWKAEVAIIPAVSRLPLNPERGGRRLSVFRGYDGTISLEEMKAMDAAWSFVAVPPQISN